MFCEHRQRQAESDDRTKKESWDGVDVEESDDRAWAQRRGGVDADGSEGPVQKRQKTDHWKTSELNPVDEVSTQAPLRDLLEAVLQMTDVLKEAGDVLERRNHELREERKLSFGGQR